MKKIIYICLCLLTLSVWGENQLRTERFAWDEISSPHFRIIFPLGMIEKARQAAFYLEEGYDRIAGDLQTEIPAPVPVILYAGHNQFEQTSILGSTVPEGLGAFAEAYRDRIVLPVDSSSRRFKYLLQHELTHIFEYAALIPRRIPSYYLIRLPFYPNWFMEGLAEYESDYDSSRRNMLLRDMAIEDTLVPMYKLFGFNYLNRHQTVSAYKQSGEFFRYLAMHDAHNPRKLLKTFSQHMPWRIDSIVTTALNQDYRELEREFRDYLFYRSKAEMEGRRDPRPADCLTPEEYYFNVFNTDAAWSPDGTRIAFFSDRDEKRRLYLMDAVGGNCKALLHWRINFTIEDIKPGKGGGIVWSPDSTELYFTGEWGNQDVIYRYNLDTGKLRELEVDFHEVRDLTVSPDGDKLAFCGVNYGVSDIYVYTIVTGALKQLTNDTYDDSAPSWNKNGWALVYASERDGQIDLITLDAQADEPALTAVQLTSAESDEMSPSWNPAGDKFAFISDATGFYEIYIMDAYNKKVYRQTNLRGGAFQPKFSPDGKSLLFSYYRGGSRHLFVLPVILDEKQIVTLQPSDQVRADLLKYSDGKAGEAVSYGFGNDFGWDALLPLGVFNWGQAGDLMSTHSIDGTLYPVFNPDGGFVSGDITYWNKVTRFDLGIGLRAGSEFDFDDDKRTDDTSLFGEARYPIDPFRYTGIGFIYGNRRTFIDGDQTKDKDRLGVFGRVGHDNRLFRGISPVKGQLLELGLEYFPGNDNDPDNEEYGYGYAIGEHAWEVKEDHIIVFELKAGVSAGPDKLDLDLGRVVRGYDLDDIVGSNSFGLSIEYRFPIHRDGNYDVLGHYLLLKDIRGFVFFDAGEVNSEPYEDFIENTLDGSHEFRHSFGAGIRLDMYGMQKAPFGLEAGFAVITDDLGEGESVFFKLDIQF